jgi:hypothetical protein
MTYIVRFEELNLLVELEQDYIHLGNKRSEEDPKRLEEQSKKKKLAKEQSKKKKLAKQRKAKREIQAWIKRHGFPDDIKHKIMQIVDEKLNEDIYVDVENLFLSLPQELKNDVNRHLYFDMLKKVSYSAPIYFLKVVLLKIIMVLISHKQPHAIMIDYPLFFLLKS